MGWYTDWLLVPREKVGEMLEVRDANTRDLRDLCPRHLSFHDGDVEGSDLNNLWSVVQGPPGGRNICDEIFRDWGKRKPKLGRVSAEFLHALAEMGEPEVVEAATAWVQTGNMRGCSVEAAARVIRELRELSQRAVSEGQAVLLEWWY
jgi:hypothetical protein